MRTRNSLDCGDTDAGVLRGRFRRNVRPNDSQDTSGRLNLAIARAKQGDADAIRYLYVRYADNVYGYVRSIVRDDHDAEDVTQHVFAKLMKAIGRYEQREVPFSAWILRVAHNVAIDHIRQRRSIPVEEVRRADEGYQESSYNRSRTLKDALEQLPAEQREVLVLRHVLGLSPGEIAERLGKSEGSIHGLHHRGRGALRTVLVEMDAAPATAAV